MISTYRDALSISMGFCRGDMDEAVIDDVLSLTADEVAVAARGACGRSTL